MSSPEPSRFRKRIEARRAQIAAGLGDAVPMTEEDRANLSAFEADMLSVTGLLNKEVAAIAEGRFEAVNELYERKAELLKRIEFLMPVVEPFLRQRLDEDEELRGRLRSLKAAVQEDSALLARMSAATSEIVRELDKIRDRHSLKGLYGKSGRRLSDSTSDPRLIDKTI
ncbi:hypothetical protein FGG78_29560 [Thioclava sp. BHET1]|nr:hypothetical protein FGG78_29560 [Thioclava sp. BHET1]